MRMLSKSSRPPKGASSLLAVSHPRVALDLFNQFGDVLPSSFRIQGDPARQGFQDQLRAGFKRLWSRSRMLRVRTVLA